jgi:hypothetical protein
VTRSIHYNIKTARAISPQSLGATAGGGVMSLVVDRNGFESLEFLVGIGPVVATDATVTAVIYEGDATGALAVATSTNVIGTLNLVTPTTPRVSGVSSKVEKRIGYIGPHRYVGIKLVPTVSGAIVAHAPALLGNPHYAAVASQ